MTKELYIGIMSGTSLDGIDIALCAIKKGQIVCEAFEDYSLPIEIKELTLSLIENMIRIEQIGELDYKIAKLYAGLVNDCIEKWNLLPSDICAIGSHGQTVWHEPNGKYPFSMQLGNPSLLAVLTGIDVVANFRAKDIAYKGQGAPFAPAFHQEVFGDIKQCAVVNIGGMANITILGKELIGYDTGCGNVLMDLWINECLDKPYDDGGHWASTGKVNELLLNNLLSDNYFKLNYPKSTGREYFNKSFLRNYLEPLDKIADEDVQATLLALTAHSIANEIKKFNIKELLVCGGGAKNDHLIASLQRLLPEIDINPTSRYGIGEDSLEAIIFAWLAYKRLNKETVPLKSVTGATKNTILGGIYAAT